MFRAQTLLIAGLRRRCSPPRFLRRVRLEFHPARPWRSARARGLRRGSQAAGLHPEPAQARRCEVIEDAFTAKTPKGDIAMKNIIAKFPGQERQSHRHHRPFRHQDFPGPQIRGRQRRRLLHRPAARTGPRAGRQPRIDDVYLVWFDGEEAFGESGTATTIVYGSRHLAERWRKDGTLREIKALINVDMIGDKSLNIKQETNSRRAPAATGLEHRRRPRLSGLLSAGDVAPIDDDHMPFVSWASRHRPDRFRLRRLAHRRGHDGQTERAEPGDRRHSDARSDPPIREVN